MDTTAIRRHLAAAAADAPRVGAFLALYDPDSDITHRNYAVPVPDVAPTDADVAGLIDFYRARNRVPRVEYLAPADDLAALLAAASIGTDERCPLMAAADLVEPPEPAGLDVRLVTATDDLAAAAAAQNDAYGEPETTPADTDRLVRLVAAGGRVSVAVDRTNGTVAGAGLHTPAVDGIVKIAAIGTVEGYRRRGVAARVCWQLAVAAAGDGGSSFLEAAAEAERRIYARVGFDDVGVAVGASLTG